MRHLLVVCTLVGLVGPAPGQERQPDRTAMYEDVEVMRRLVADAVAQARSAAAWHHLSGAVDRPYAINDVFTTSSARLGQPSNTVWVDLVNNNLSNPWRASQFIVDYGVYNPPAYSFALTRADLFAEPPPTDGTYLKGVGPVFHLTLDAADAAALEPPVKAAGLASNCARCHGPAMDQKVRVPTAGPKREPPDPWEAKLRQVRGEKDPPAPEPRATQLGRDEICLPGTLTELVLNSLTKYGHRFRDLSAGERITVVVTVKPAPKPAAANANDPAAQARSQAEEQLALGDLHSKQGKSDEAVAAYRKGIDRLMKPLSFSESVPYDQVTKATEEATKALRAAHGKLAQALLAAGKLDEAKAAIEAAKGASVTIAADKPKPAPPAKPPLPTKLTVSLTKKAIDDHKGGKIDLFELRSAAEVEAVGFPVAQGKAAKQ